ncbi:hypothetical protein ACE6H2_014391 [Prunus campanulata]
MERLASDKYNVSPFQTEAEKAGVEHAGGKIDDITVVVAQVGASSTSFTTPASLGFGFEHTNTKRKGEDYISFQDVQNSGGRGKKASASPSQAVAAGIFQINTAISTFRRLVDAIGTAKDTPDHRQKLHNTRQRILELVKDTSAKLKALSESDHHINVNLCKSIILSSLSFALDAD